MKKLSEEEIIYRNVESYLRTAIIELANIEDSELDVVNCLVNTINHMRYAVAMRKERQKELMEAARCGL